MSSLAATVTGLASGVERASVGSGAVPRDMSELAASIALHRLRLAVTGIVVGTAALVAGSRTSSSVATAEAAGVTASWRTGNASSASSARVGAGSLEICQS